MPPCHSLKGPRPYLDLEVIADVATVEFGADQLELPVKEGLCVPVLVTDEMQDLLVVGHGVHTCDTGVKTNVTANKQRVPEKNTSETYTHTVEQHVDETVIF